MHLDPEIAALLEGLNHPALPGIDLSLARMRQLLDALGNPECRVPPTIHVAGTNGKGSTIAFMRAALEAQGLRVHIYSSPHLVRFNERIVLAGAEISDAALKPLLGRVAAAACDIAVTFFEATTAAAFLAFAEQEADVLLLEVGLGGRLDATNMVGSIAAVFTPIAMDHQEYLGSTLEAIAGEKAGILKPSCRAAFSAVQAAPVREVLATRAQALGIPLHISTPKPLALPLAGIHQHQNAALAHAVVEWLGYKTDEQALSGAAWPGRLQRMTHGPLVEQWGAPFWLDGAHNAHAAAALGAWAAEQAGPCVLVCGMMARKDAEAFFRALGPSFSHIITVPIAGHADAQMAATLAENARAAGHVAEHAPNLSAALAMLQRYQPATLLVAGSLYLVGEVLKIHDSRGK